MHVSGVFLPLVTACVGVSMYPVQHQHRGEMGCAGPHDVVHPAAALALPVQGSEPRNTASTTVLHAVGTCRDGFEGCGLG